MLIKGDERRSQLIHCVAVAGQFLMSTEEAMRLIAKQVAIIKTRWASCAMKPTSHRQIELFFGAVSFSTRMPSKAFRLTWSRANHNG
jgi:hypothetical protein